ncbi:glycoside hydrolase family 9 protein [Cohnella sp.]|uniref:glycoside hydrolase family 9 protein n=1 Tax=Cohnella sp. TaxID=1883426 RepID=UPI0035612979
MKAKKLLTQIACIAVVFASVISPAAASTSYGAPAGWRDIPDYHIFTDTYYGWSGSSGELETINGQLPVDTQEMYENLPSLRFNVTQPNMAWMVAILVMAGWASHDVSAYVPNGFLEFNVKGEVGGEQFKIGAVDHVSRREPDEITITVPVADYTTVTTEWQHVKIPLKDILDPSLGIEAYNAKAIILDRVNNEPFNVLLNQIKFTTTDIEQGYEAIKLNQVGYLNSAEKYAYVSGFEDELQATVGTEFQVKRVSDNSVAYTGQLVLVKDYDIDSGERVLKAVFTDLEESGDYYITVNADGIEDSFKFKIGDDVFKPLLSDAARYFYYQRSGTALEPQYAPDFPRADITPMDTAAPFESNSAITREVSKGWFDAGDKGKFLSNGAWTAMTLLWSSELFPESYSDNQFNIPESGNGVPDILDEARWELEWILKMQDSVSGGFYAKVESMNNDDNNRAIRDKRDDVTNVRPTNDTAWAANILAHASMAYAQYDPVFADTCLNAAISAWMYLEQNPDNIKGPDGTYATDSDKDSRLVAAASLYRATGGAQYNDYFVNNYAQSQTSFDNPEGDWVGIWHYAFFHYMKSENLDMDTVNWYKDNFTIWLNKEINRYQSNAWNNTIFEGNYYWGSNNMMLGTVNEALIGSKLLGMNNETINNMALSALNYMLGANAMSKSFVTGYGDNAIKTVFGTFNNDPRPGVPKGWIPLGANKYNGGGSSNFPAKDFLDSDSEWTTNEHSIGSNASLVFISAFANSYHFNDQTTPVTTATVTPAAPTGSNGWYTSDVTVSLTANDDLSGVAKTEYSLDGGTTWQTYTVPVTLSQDGQYTVSYRSTDNVGNVEAAKTISFNLDSTAPEITVTGVESGTYNDSLDVTPVITLDDSLSGIDASKTTVTLDGNGVEQGATIPLYTLPLGSHTFIVTASDLAGNTSSQEIVFQTTTSIQSMQALVTLFTNAGWIDNSGIANSLQSKLASNALADLVSHVTAQRGKHISVEAADYLIRDAEYLLSLTTGQ